MTHHKEPEKTPFGATVDTSTLDSPSDRHRSIAAISADFRAAGVRESAHLVEAKQHWREGKQAHDHFLACDEREDAANDRALAERRTMGRLVWEMRQHWAENPEVGSWEQFSEQHFGKPSREISQLLKLGRAADPKEQARDEIRDIVAQFVDARIVDVREDVRRELVRRFAELMEVDLEPPPAWHGVSAMPPNGESAVVAEETTP